MKVNDTEIHIHFKVILNSLTDLDLHTERPILCHQV